MLKLSSPPARPLPRCGRSSSPTRRSRARRTAAPRSPNACTRHRHSRERKPAARTVHVSHGLPASYHPRCASPNCRSPPPQPGGRTYAAHCANAARAARSASTAPAPLRWSNPAAKTAKIHAQLRTPHYLQLALGGWGETRASNMLTACLRIANMIQEPCHSEPPRNLLPKYSKGSNSQKFKTPRPPPGVELRANFKSISHRNHLFEVVFVCKLTK